MASRKIDLTIWDYGTRIVAIGESQEGKNFTRKITGAVYGYFVDLSTDQLPGFVGACKALGLRVKVPASR